MARPTKYNPQYHVPWAEGLTLRGATIEEIADSFDVAVSTVNKWIKDYPEFSDAIKKNRDLADFEVEKSLLKRAKGYTVTEKKTIVQSGKDGEQKPVKIEINEKHIPADITACIFWLKNRNPDLWRDKRDIDANILMDEQEDDELTKGLESLADDLNDQR